MRPGAAYTVGAKIGEGLSGVVYECADQWGNALVAKVLLPNPIVKSHNDVKQRWLAEIDMMAKFRHPNVLFLHDAFELKNTFYLIVERCDSSLEHGAMSAGLVMPVALAVLQALEFMHARGFVHLDVQPRNVFLRSVCDCFDAGRAPVTVVKLGDMGNCKKVEKIIKGVFIANHLRAPETQAADSYGAVSRRTDVYQAALLLLGLAMGGYRKFTPEEIMADEPRRVAVELGGGYGKALARALGMSMFDRPSTAGEFWGELKAAALPR